MERMVKKLAKVIYTTLLVCLTSCVKIDLNKLEGPWSERYDPTVFVMDGSLKFTFDGNGNYQLHTYDALSGESYDRSGY